MGGCLSSPAPAAAAAPSAEKDAPLSLQQSIEPSTPPSLGNIVVAVSAGAKQLDLASTASGTSSGPLALTPDTPSGSQQAPVLEDLHSVQTMLSKVSSLIQRFAEGRSERSTPVQSLRRALHLVVTDSGADYGSIHIFSEGHEKCMLVSVHGAPEALLANSHKLLRVSGSSSSLEAILLPSTYLLHWSGAGDSAPAWTDWQLLASEAGLHGLSAVPIKANDKVLAMITLGFKAPSCSAYDSTMWPTYLQLVAASFSSMVRDTALLKYVALLQELSRVGELDEAMHALIHHVRRVLGHNSSHHAWYRIGLCGTGNSAATIFDDFTQVPTALVQRSLSLSKSGLSTPSAKVLKEVAGVSGVMRSVVAMKSTVMKIAVSNRQQVMIPDVQKVINQSGSVSADIFNTRLIKPPTSVLMFPLKHAKVAFGVVYAMSSVATDFADVAPKLREVCEIVSPHLLHLFSGALSLEYKLMQLAQPHNSSTSNNPNASQEGLSSMLSSFDRPVFSSAGGGVAGILAERGSTHASLSGDSFVYTQSRSSTGALVTGLTEKLNQKRIKSSMEFFANSSLADLQITALLGEGGFAKVFAGLWRSLVVGIKVVADDGRNEKSVMKNAHEIAILSALSHPNIVQAYTCLTDVLIRDFLTVCSRHTTPNVIASPAFQYLLGLEDKPCHIEVIEYCDLGNMSTALKNHIFLCDASEDPATQVKHGKVNMRSLLLSLVEVASACAYLHRMGVVHCDIKPANLLLKSCSNDTRGFTIKVSDFGLSRVEDDDISSSFPFNSCGTAAYVAPEALVSNKKVNCSVDVYAFGIIMHELYTGQRPYGNMKQQQLVEEVVMRGLRPRFSRSTPPAYVAIASACWHATAAERPTFDDVLNMLHAMLQEMTYTDPGSPDYYSNEVLGSDGRPPLPYLSVGSGGSQPPSPLLSPFLSTNPFPQRNTSPALSFSPHPAPSFQRSPSGSCGSSSPRHLEEEKQRRALYARHGSSSLGPRKERTPGERLAAALAGANNSNSGIGVGGIVGPRSGTGHEMGSPAGLTLDSRMGSGGGMPPRPVTANGVNLAFGLPPPSLGPLIPRRASTASSIADAVLDGVIGNGGRIPQPQSPLAVASVAAAAAGFSIPPCPGPIRATSLPAVPPLEPMEEEAAAAVSFAALHALPAVAPAMPPSIAATGEARHKVGAPSSLKPASTPTMKYEVLGVSATVASSVHGQHASLVHAVGAVQAVV